VSSGWPCHVELDSEWPTVEKINDRRFSGVMCNYIHRGRGGDRSKGDNYSLNRSRSSSSSIIKGLIPLVPSDELRTSPTCECRGMECADVLEISCCSA
jgi:hypothetical protein